MIEIPEAIILANQMKEYLHGKVVDKVVVNQSPHKLAWFYGNPGNYPKQLVGRKVVGAKSVGGFVQLLFDEGYQLMFSEGVKLRFFQKGEKDPVKHQLLLTFDDETTLVAVVQMYGGLFCYKDNFCLESMAAYYQAALDKPGPLTEAFSFVYFKKLVLADEVIGKSVKAVLATEQRIPGLGNGILQDILFGASVHPKRKMKSLNEEELKCLYESIKSTIHKMVVAGGRDTESDLWGCKGGYKTKMSKNTVGKPCEVCGETIVKAAYMGGSVYFCPVCQSLES